MNRILLKLLLFSTFKTHAWFPRTSLELRFLSFRAKGLDTMFCLIWYGLVTGFTGRIFKSLPHFRFCPFLGLLCKQANRSLILIGFPLDFTCVSKWMFTKRGACLYFQVNDRLVKQRSKDAQMAMTFLQTWIFDKF